MIFTQIPYRIEPELTAPRPRRARFTATTQKSRFRIWILSAIPFLIATLYGFHATETHQTLLKRGRVTNARVLSLDSTLIVRGRMATLPTVIVKFRADAADVTGAVELKSAEYAKIKVGDPLVVTYLSDNPKSFVSGRVADSDVVQTNLDWLIGSSFVAVMSIAYLFLVERYFWNRRRLLRDGKAVAATVIGHQTAESGETATYFVRYEYPDANGTKVAGRLAVSPKRARDFPDGSRLTILCLPDSREPGLPYVSITEAKIVPGH